MKFKEKNLAKKMRRKGSSLREIALALNVSKGSVSVWVRDIKLNSNKENILNKKSQSKESIEKRRVSRIRNEKKKREAVIENAKKDLSKMSKKDLFHFGIAFYWGEGSKTRRGIVEFYNSDYRSIVLMMRFFKEICLVDNSKFRGHVYLHEESKVIEAEKYWSDVSGIPLDQFFKTTIQKSKNKSSKEKIPMGTFSIGVYNTELFLRIMGWIDGIYEKNII